MEYTSDDIIGEVFENIRDMFIPVEDLEHFIESWNEDEPFFPDEEIRNISLQCGFLTKYISHILMVLMKCTSGEMMKELTNFYRQFRRLDFKYVKFPCIPYLTNQLIEETDNQICQETIINIAKCLQTIHSSYYKYINESNTYSSLFKVSLKKIESCVINIIFITKKQDEVSHILMNLEYIHTLIKT